GNPMVLAGAYAGFSPNLFVERAVGLAYRILIVLAIFGIAQRWGALIATGCAILTIVLLAGTDLWANTWYTGLSFALCSLWAMADVTSSWRCFIAGLLGGIALLGRCDFGPVLIASSLPLFLSMERNVKLKFIAGIVLALSPLIWMALIIGPMPIFHSLFVFPVFKLNPGRHLAISAAPWQMQCLLFLQIGASIMNIAAGIVEFRDRASRQRGCLLLGVGLLGIGLIHYALQRFDPGHALNSALLAVSFLPLSILILSSAVRKAFPRKLAALAAALAMLIFLGFIAPAFTRFYRSVRVTLGLDAPHQATKTGEQLEPGDKGIFIVHHGRPFAFGFPYAAECEKISNSGGKEGLICCSVTSGSVMQLFRHRHNVANYFPRRSSHGFSIDSKITLPDIFECPARRSVNVIGISTIRRPSCCARKTVST